MQQIVITTPEELETIIHEIFNALSSDAQFPSPDHDEHFLSLKEAALFLGLAPQTIYGLTSKKSIPFYKTGKKLRFLKSELRKWLLNNPVKPSEITAL